MGTTCTANGSCSRCGATQAAYGHNYTDFIYCDAAHPHGVYKQCYNCGNKVYNGMYQAKIHGDGSWGSGTCPDCGTHTWGSVEYETAHPHAAYQDCVCRSTRSLGYDYSGDYPGCASCIEREVDIICQVDTSYQTEYGINYDFNISSTMSKVAYPFYNRWGIILNPSTVNVSNLSIDSCALGYDTICELDANTCGATCENNINSDHEKNLYRNFYEIIRDYDIFPYDLMLTASASKMCYTNDANVHSSGILGLGSVSGDYALVKNNQSRGMMLNENLNEAEIEGIANSIKLVWSRNDDGKKLLEYGIRNMALKPLDEAGLYYYMDVSYPTQPDEVLTILIYWVQDGMRFNLQVPIELYNQITGTDIKYLDSKADDSAQLLSEIPPEFTVTKVELS